MAFQINKGLEIGEVSSLVADEDPVRALELVGFSTLTQSLVTNQNLITKQKKGRCE